MSQGADRETVAAALGLAGSRPSTSGPRIITVSGPAGIGKSQILRFTAADWVARGNEVVRVVGAQFDQHVPLGAARQLLDMVSGHATTTPEPPEIGERGSATENIEMTVAADVIAALDECADRDALVIIDDAHWLDETSRRVIDFALRRLDDRAPPTLLAQRHGLATVALGEHLDVSGLSRDEFDGLIAERSAETTLSATDEAWTLTAGNPLAAIEWTKSSSRNATIDVARTVADRLSSCSMIERQALCMLAVCRRGDALTDAWRATEPDGSNRDLATTIRSSSAADLIEPDAPLRFRHPEYQEAAASCVDGDERARVVRALATTTADTDSAAWHLADSCETASDEVARLLGEVARRSIERGTPIEAAHASERAAELAFDPALAIDQQIAAGEAWWYACFPHETARVTADGWDAPVDLARRVRLRQLHRAAVGWQRNVMETIRGYLDDASLVDDSDSDLAAGLRVSAFIEACLAGQPDLAGEIADELATALASTPAESASPMWAGVLSVCRGFASILRGQVDADDLDPAAAGDAQRSGDLAAIAFFATLDPTKLETSALNLLQLVGYGDMVLDRRTEAATTLTGLRVEAQTRGATAITDFTEACLAELERRRGRWASALSRTMTDIDIDPTRTSAGKAWQRAIRARMLAAQGVDGVDDLVASVVDEAGPVGMEFITATGNVALATAALAAGDAQRACALLAEVETSAQRGGALEPGALWYELDQIEALWRCGELDGVRRVTRRLSDHAARTGRPWSLAMAALGSVLLGSASVADAAEAASHLNAPFETTRAHLILAEFERHADGRQAGGSAAIDVAHTRERLARLGATPFVRRCDDLQSGAPESAIESSTAGLLTELTPAELRVAVTVGAGKTNGEAATELFLSARTVEAHLRAIFRKLELRNRVELAAVVAAADTTAV